MTFRRKTRPLVAALFLVSVWLVAGIQSLEPSREICVLDSWIPGPFPERVEGSWALAPPGLLTLHRYPKDAIEIPLPGAEEAFIPGPGGTRYGFRGELTVRAVEENWLKLHTASRGGGFAGAVLSSVRKAGAELIGSAGFGLGRNRLAHMLNDLLGPVLQESGIELRRLELRDIEHLMADADADLPDTGTKLLLIGLDGLDWSILDPLMERGRLPNIKKLVDNGVRAKLLSLSPMLSPVIWTTAATGVEPTRHGILDFLVGDEGAATKQPVTSRQRLVPTVWEILGDQGIRVGVVAWWATWPADRVNGYLVSDRVAYQLFNYRSDPMNKEGKTWPPELYDDIRQDLVLPEEIPWERVKPFLSGVRMEESEFDSHEIELLEDFRALLASGDTYVKTAISLSRRFEPRFEAVYLEGTDTVGHLFMGYRPPKLPGVDSAGFESFREIVDRYYEEADLAVGRLLRDKGDDWTVIIMSDHGFATDATRPLTADSRVGQGQAAAWHRRFGALIMSGRNIKKGERLDEASVYDIAPTIMAMFGRPVPLPWPGAVLDEGIEGGFFDRFPVRYTATEMLKESAADQESDSTAEQLDEDMLEKLRSLGYITADSTQNDPVTFNNNSGVALMSEGKYAEAEKVFRSGLENSPDHPTLLTNLGIALRFQGKDREAAICLEKAMAHKGARRMAGHHLAQLRMDAGDMTGAERHLRQVLQYEPDADEIINTLGLVLERQNRTDEAAALYKRAAALDPDSAQPRNNLGNIAKRRGLPREAERWYLEAIEADPFFMGAYNNLALVYQSLGNLDGAIELYSKALQKAPTNAVVLNNLASLYYAKGDLEEARRLWSRCLNVLPGYPSPYNNLAGIAIRTGRYDEAERLLRTALDLDPDYGDAHVNLALVHRARGDNELAKESLQAALKDPKARPQALLQIGLLALYTGDPAAGIASLEEARPELGDTPALLNPLGEAYLQLGDAEAASEAWQRSLQVQPEQPAVRSRLETLGR